MSGSGFSVRFRPVIVAAAALMFLWPAAFNGGVFYTVDSIHYIRGSDAVLTRVFGPAARTRWSAPFSPPARPGTALLDQPPSSAPRSEASFSYGLLASLGARTGGFWLTILLQAVAAAFALDLCCRAFGLRSVAALFGVVLAAAFATPLAFNIASVAPDVWIAVAVFVAAAVAAGGERLNRLDYLLALALVTFAAVAQTPVLAALLAIILSATGLVFLRRRMRFGFGAPIALLVLASAAMTLAIYMVGAFNPVADGPPSAKPPIAEPTVLRERTWPAFKTFVLNGVDQLGSFSMEGFNEPAGVRQSIGRWMTPPERTQWMSTRAYHQGWPVKLMDLGLIGLSLGGLSGVCLLVFASGRGRMLADDELTRRLMVAAWVVVAGVTANALACGGFMGVLARQQVCALAPLILVGLAAWMALVVRQTQLMVKLYASTHPPGAGRPAQP